MSAGAGPGSRGATAEALWNLRALGLFLVGPAVGVGLVAGVFGLPPALLGVAGAMFLFSLGLFGLLLRGERRRIVLIDRPGRPGRRPAA